MWLIMISVAAFAATTISAIPCEEARAKCLFRDGCRSAIQNYFLSCSAVLQGSETNRCPEICEASLIALVSTEEGKALMECDCAGDSFCIGEKNRTNICKPNVMKMIDATVVPCTIAQWICDADAQCATAFKYYFDNCKSMFHGRKCTPKCQNSISILIRQEKAKKLTMCRCGKNDFNCRNIQKNMAKLCIRNSHHNNHNNISQIEKYHPIWPNLHQTTEEPPEVILISSSETFSIFHSFIFFISSLLLLFWL